MWQTSGYPGMHFGDCPTETYLTCLLHPQSDGGGAGGVIALSRRVGNLLPTRFTMLESKRCVTSNAPYGPTPALAMNSVNPFGTNGL